MPEATGDTTRRPGRPRSEQARQAVLAAALELAAEQGPAGIHMEAIAKRAGVSKETVYRWWRSKTEVVLEALSARSERTIRVPDSGDFHRDLQTFLRDTVDAGDAGTVGLLLALAAGAAADAAFAAEVRDRFLATRRAALLQVLDHAVARNEITPAFAAVALDLIYGSLWYRLIFRVGPLDHHWADATAAAICHRPTPAT